jgi:hypothetical protein
MRATMSNKIARKQRQRKKLKNHVAWLETMHKAGVQLDMEKIMKTKTPKIIIDKLVSKENKDK